MKSVWSETVPTLVGSMKMVMREWVCIDGAKTTVKVRLLEGIEYMGFMGWHPSWFAKSKSATEKVHDCATDVHYIEMLANIAGNAMSVNH